MHVLLLGPVPPPQGGVQTHLMALRQFLRASGVEVSVINITRHRKNEGDGIYYPASAAGLLRVVSRLRPDLTHIHLGGNLGRRDLLLCLAMSALPRTPSVLTFHSGGYPVSAAGQAARPGSFPGRVLRRLDGLIGVNQQIVEVFHRFGVRPARVRLIAPHNTTTLTSSVALPPRLEAFAGAHEPLLVTVGLLEHEYSVDLQLDSMPAILEAHPTAGLAIIGSGSLAQELAERIARSPARDRILLCGDVPHDATLAMIRRASVLLRPTKYDGDSVSVREALAMGTPVLASDTGMRPPGVRLMAALTQQALCDGISEALRHPRLPPADATSGDNLPAVLRLYGEILGQGSRVPYT